MSRGTGKCGLGFARGREIALLLRHEGEIPFPVARIADPVAKGVVSEGHAVFRAVAVGRERRAFIVDDPYRTTFHFFLCRIASGGRGDAHRMRAGFGMENFQSVADLVLFRQLGVEERKSSVAGKVFHFNGLERRRRSFFFIGLRKRLVLCAWLCCAAATAFATLSGKKSAFFVRTKRRVTTRLSPTRRSGPGGEGESLIGRKVMEEFINEVFGSYAGLVLSVMGVCAAVSALLPAPSDASGTWYRALYGVLNFFAVNVGRARNADDAEKDRKAV